MAQRIIIIKTRKNFAKNDVNEELKWLGNSLGLFGLRDRDSSCFRVFIALLKRAGKNDTISSDEIAERLSLSRGTVIHHLTKLMDSGIVIREKNGYLLKESTLEGVIDNMKRDVGAIFEELTQVAKEIDDGLGL
ncbi:winged helix-turn-helix transcriptional regulator [Candidatus Woesearchaeota archaeon]|nr:winged helix-turn-helix transcriptional regulator [Candidatus Woesearchaeota archaeon]